MFTCLVHCRKKKQLWNVRKGKSECPVKLSRKKGFALSPIILVEDNENHPISVNVSAEFIKRDVAAGVDYRMAAKLRRQTAPGGYSNDWISAPLAFQSLPSHRRELTCISVDSPSPVICFLALYTVALSNGYLLCYGLGRVDCVGSLNVTCLVGSWKRIFSSWKWSNWGDYIIMDSSSSPAESCGGGSLQDVYAQLVQKERDLLLAAQLGKALLEKNEELGLQNEKMAEEYSRQLEVSFFFFPLLPSYFALDNILIGRWRHPAWVEWSHSTLGKNEKNVLLVKNAVMSSFEGFDERVNSFIFFFVLFSFAWFIRSE